jgi:hypothetical protein
MALADTALAVAIDLGCLPLAWQLRATRAQALERIGRSQEASREYALAADVIRKLAGSIDDVELRRGFVADSLVAAVLAAAERRD